MIPLTPLDEWTARRLRAEQSGGLAAPGELAYGSPSRAPSSPSSPLTRAALTRWQSARLVELVEFVRARSPFYRRLYAGLPPGVPRGLADLQRLPFIRPEDLRLHGLDLVCVSLGDIARVVTVPTSGSTGGPKRMWFTEEDLELTVDHFRHGMRALVEPGDRVLVLMPGATPGSVGALLTAALARDGVTAEAYGFVDDCDTVAGRIEEFGADCLVGIPSQLLRLARSREGSALPRGRLKSVLLTGDYVAPALREAIAGSWGCRVFEHYGSTEIGLGGGVQCAAFGGLHVREADLVFEVVHPDSGASLPLGEAGELVVTTLTRRGMPLIRYRTGDTGRLLSGRCPCGSLLRRLDKLSGRLEDVVALGSGCSLDLGRLDEVLYAWDRVVAFSAELEDAPERSAVGARDRLEADARLLIRLALREVADGESGAREELDRVLERIRGIPAVRDSDTQVDIELRDEADIATQAKRRIRDVRRKPPAACAGARTLGAPEA